MDKKYISSPVHTLYWTGLLSCTVHCFCDCNTEMFSCQEPFQQVPKEETCFGPSSSFGFSGTNRWFLHIKHHGVPDFSTKGFNDLHIHWVPRSISDIENIHCLLSYCHDTCSWNGQSILSQNSCNFRKQAYSILCTELKAQTLISWWKNQVAASCGKINICNLSKECALIEEITWNVSLQALWKRREKMLCPY